MSLTVPSTPRRIPWSEAIRILILIAAAVTVMFPFFTSNIIGGVDARWYAYMLADYIEQARLGHILVSVGQGPFAWNGSVHLFRSAPVYMAVARVWDLLTLHRLNAFALQHLTVLSSAVGGTVGFYAVAVRIIPNRRWIATGLALLYLTTPSWLSTILHTEAYMSYMAFAALPIVLYGNALTVLRSDGRGYIVLGAGLALLWMCHPPIAFNTTMATLVIQSSLIMARGVVSWANLAAGVAAFAILAAFYFTSMGELPRQAHTEPPSYYLAQIAGFALFFIGIGRYALFPRMYGWAICAAAGAWLVWVTDYPWLCWAAGTAAVWLVCVLMFWFFDGLEFKKHAFVVLFFSTLAGAAVAEAWVGRDGIFGSPLNLLSRNTAHIRDILVPLDNRPNSYQIFQPGFGLISIFVVSVASLFGSRPLGAKIFFAVVLGLVTCFLRVPLVSNFLLGRFPVDFAAMCGVPLDLRIMPVIASFTAMAGVIWVSTIGAHSRTTGLVVGSILAVLVLWSGYQSMPFLRHSHEMTGTEYATEKNMRPENAMLDAYAYLLLPIPSYFSHGKTDPLLESRLLDAAGGVVVGPTEDALIMENVGSQKIRMLTSLLPNSTNWFAVGAGITVKPGEHILLRFEFDPNRNYSGYFILQAEHSYREYHLPDSGLPSAFGVGGSHTSVLSLWNTGATPEHYNMSLSAEPGNDIPHSGAFFAELYVSRLDSSRLPVSLKSFIPYRAAVSSDKSLTLETFRVYMPGYHAKVDGNDAPVIESKDHLASVRLTPGIHEVELRFVGTVRLWLAAAISGIGWACFVLYGVFASSPKQHPAFG